MLWLVNDNIYAEANWKAWKLKKNNSQRWGLTISLDLTERRYDGQWKTQGNWLKATIKVVLICE